MFCEIDIKYLAVNKFQVAMAVYSNAALCNMHLMYDRVNGIKARRFYIEAYPDFFLHIVWLEEFTQRLCDTGSLGKQCHLSGGRRLVITLRTEEIVAPIEGIYAKLFHVDA